MRARIALLLTILAAAISVSCIDQPEESTMGPSAAAVDSAAWRAQMAHRPGLFLSATMTDCNSGACTFAPTDYHCGGQKVECSFQGDPILTTPTTMVPQTIIVSGSGALLCNATMGTVVAYGAADEVLTTIPLVPIAPSDCGADNITFGGTATIALQEGVHHIIIEPMSPWTFPVGGGTGIAHAFYNVQINDEAVPFTVSCPAAPTRADGITCTATKTNPASNATVTGWHFTADTGTWDYKRATDTTSLTWTGTVVGSGHVEVMGAVNGTPFPLPAVSNAIVVQPRSWSNLTSTKTVTLVSPNSLPAQPKDSAGVLGGTLSLIPALTSPPYAVVQDGGPNDGYGYYTALPG